jgi:hypothetical protein
LVLPVPGNPCPGVLGAACGAAFKADLSFLAFCTHSGQVTSLALADWNHLPQVMQRILILLMRGLPCKFENSSGYGFRARAKVSECTY